MDINWYRTDTSYLSEGGISTYTEWLGKVVGTTNTMLLLAGEGKKSLPPTSQDHHDDYTAVQVRAFRNSDGEFLWLQELDQSLMEHPVDTVEALWSVISTFTGDPREAHRSI